MHDFFLYAYVYNCVMFYSCAPTIMVFGTCEIDGIATYLLAYEYAISEQHRVGAFVYGVGDRVVLYGVKVGIKAFATMNG